MQAAALASLKQAVDEQAKQNSDESLRKMVEELHGTEAALANREVLNTHIENTIIGIENMEKDIKSDLAAVKQE